MPEFLPIARSPIVPKPPVKRIGRWEVSGLQSAASLRLIDLTPCSKVLLRSVPAKPASDELPKFGYTRRLSDGTLAVAAVPKQWLLIAGPSEGSQMGRWTEAGEDASFLAIDVTDARVLLRLSGELSSTVLSKVCAINCQPKAFSNGRAVRSSLAEVPCEIVRDDVTRSPTNESNQDSVDTMSYLIFCERQVGQYVADSLVAAGSEYKIEIDGFQFD